MLGRGQRGRGEAGIQIPTCACVCVGGANSESRRIGMNTLHVCVAEGWRGPHLLCHGLQMKVADDGASYTRSPPIIRQSALVLRTLRHASLLLHIKLPLLLRSLLLCPCRPTLPSLTVVMLSLPFRYTALRPRPAAALLSDPPPLPKVMLPKWWRCHRPAHQS